jgi:tRNA nucleotidyltransferase/poly(A) polymerase
MLKQIPEEVKRAAEVLAGAGKKAYLVGGALRDGLLGLVPKDWDVATDAPPEEVMNLFRRRGHAVVPTGIRFGTVAVFCGRLPVEITTFRTENDYRDFRRPSLVRFSTDLLQDLRRRDFTVNALALDLVTGCLIDPFGGRRDLHLGIVRTVGPPRERFEEDPLRMLRGFRLASELGFRMDAAALVAAAARAELLSKVAKERIQAEISRILTGPWAAEALPQMALCGVLFAVIPELREGWGFPQRHPAHQWPVFQHLVETVRYVPGNLALRLAALLHDVAKPRCFFVDEQGVGHFFGHDRASADMAGHILRRLRWDNRTREAVVALVRWHMFPLVMAVKGIRRLVLRVGEERVKELLVLKQADLLATGPVPTLQAEAALARFRQALEEVLHSREAISIRDLAVDGRDVMRVMGLSPGPEVGKVLRLLHQEVLAEPARNNREYLLERLSQLAKRRNPPSAGE